MHSSENPCNQRWLRTLQPLSCKHMAKFFSRRSYKKKRGETMCYTQLGLELSSFIGDAFCCVLFKVK